MAFAVAVELAFDVGSPSAAPRCQCLKRIRCGVCLSIAQRSEFSRAPFQVLATWEPRAAGRRSRGRLFLPTCFGEAKQVGRLPGRTPGLVVWQGKRVGVSGVKHHCEAAFVSELGFEASKLKTKATVQRQAPDAPIPMSCQTTKPGVRPGGRVPSFASPK